MAKLRKPQCVSCDSFDVDIEAGSGHCNDCNADFKVDTWNECPDCGCNMRTVNTISGMVHGTLARTARRQCMNPECKYTQTAITTVAFERPRNGQGHASVMSKLREGKLTVRVEDGK